jgi:hypothetical protein
MLTLPERLFRFWHGQREMFAVCTGQLLDHWQFKLLKLRERELPIGLGELIM